MWKGEEEENHEVCPCGLACVVCVLSCEDPLCPEHHHDQKKKKTCFVVRFLTLCALYCPRYIKTCPTSSQRSLEKNISNAAIEPTEVVEIRRGHQKQEPTGFASNPCHERCTPFAPVDDTRTNTDSRLRAIFQMKLEICWLFVDACSFFSSPFLALCPWLCVACNCFDLICLPSVLSLLLHAADPTRREKKMSIQQSSKIVP